MFSRFSPVLVVSASRCDAEAFATDTWLGRSLARPAHHGGETLIRFANDQSLACTYNAAIDQASPDTLIAFCHDDIWLGDRPLAPELNEALQSFDLVGVAGSSRLLPGQSSWCCLPNSPIWDHDHLVGQIRHGDPHTSHRTVFGPTPASALLLDGVFLAARAGTLQRSGVRFDEQFDFHFYDLDFCRCASAAGLRLGVWPLALIHASGGNPGTPGWLRCWERYRRKWGEPPPERTIPPSSPSTPTAASLPSMTTTQPSLEITTSRQLVAWMAEQHLSIALTTYQIGKLFTLGLRSGGELAVFERTFNRCMGLCPTANGNGFYLSSLHQIWRFENSLAADESADDFDRVYIPQLAVTTGDCDIHDMAVDADGQLVFVNTLFSCLATTSNTHSFRPLWRPPFISRLAAEDRCHLNGLAMRDGRPAFVTAVSTSDAADGWRERRRDGGVLIDVQNNEIVATGLSMPHSPRWYREQLWLCNSGTGEFGTVDLATGHFEPVSFCAGYLRGVAFHGDYALLGTSLPRDNRTFNGLQLQEALEERNVEARCGIQVVDLRSGDAVHWIRFEGLVTELYDVITLPEVRNPSLIGVVSDEIRRIISIEANPAMQE
jgi:hypothetical protein